jgi:autotransporter-associated beta strand protein
MPDERTPSSKRLSSVVRALVARLAVGVAAFFVLLSGEALAQLTLNRYIQGPGSNDPVPIGGSFFSTNNWTNNGFTNISGVSVNINLSSPEDADFWALITDAVLLYNLADTTNGVTEVVYSAQLFNQTVSSLDATFTLTNTFNAPQTNNEWQLNFFNGDEDEGQEGPAIFNYWRLIVTGDAVTNGTISVGQQGIISGSDGYTVTATIDAGSGTGTNAVTAFVTNGQSLNFNGGISGTGELAKTGAGTLSLAGNSTNFSGTFSVGAGTANITSTNALGTGVLVQSDGSSTVIFSAGGTYANNMSLYNVSFTNGGNVLTGTITNNNTTYTVAAGTTNTLSGVLTGDGGVTKEGDGALIIAGSANNTYTGATVVNDGSLVLSNSSGNAINDSSSITVNSGGTLVLGASNQIGDSVGLILSGGTLLVGADTVSDTIGSLTLTGSANSIIDFGDYGSSGTRSLTFGSFSAIEWTGSLIITNWQGTVWTPDNTHLFFTDSNGFTSGQLADQIVFAGIGTGAGFIEGGELVPVPEPKLYVAALAICAAIGWRERKRLRDFLGKVKLRRS